jgi:hypothetical protein
MFFFYILSFVSLKTYWTLKFFEYHSMKVEFMNLKALFIFRASLAAACFICLTGLFLGFGRLEAECRVCEQKKNPPKEINSLPYTITEEGKYFLSSTYAWYPERAHRAVIFIESDNVWLDLKGNTLNLQGFQGAGIIIEGKKNVHIMNGSIVNSNCPSSIVENGSADHLYGLAALGTRSEALHFASCQYASPCTSCVGIVMQPGSKSVKLQILTFKDIFIGIAGIDNVNHAEIIKCIGINCGIDSSFVDAGDAAPKGGFIIIAPSQPYDNIFASNIEIRNCKAFGHKSLFGIALFNCQNSNVKNCIIDFGNPNIFSDAGGLVAILCQNCAFQKINDPEYTPCVKTLYCQNCSVEE